MVGNIVDLDWYFDITIKGVYALDFIEAMKSLGQRELLITATTTRNRQAYFLSPKGNSNNWREFLKASSALPFLYKQGVKLAPQLNVSTVNQTQAKVDYPQADFYLDGGLAAPLPVRESYRRGARKIVVIRTVNADLHTQSAWLRNLKSWIYESGYCPKIVAYLVQHEHAYQEELTFIDNPPEDVEIIQIFAKDNLQSKQLSSTYMDLQHDYRAGIAAGNAFLQDNKESVLK